MNTLTLIYVICIIYGIGMLLWMKTERGKKWLAEL